jgi:chemotaxis response regulator CheB
MAGPSIVVIGGSTGALEALLSITRRLPGDLPAAVFVTIHTSSASPGVIDQIVARSGALPASYAVDGAPIEPGHIYIAPAAGICSSSRATCASHTGRARTGSVQRSIRSFEPRRRPMAAR